MSLLRRQKIPLWEKEGKHTIQQLIDQHEILLHGLLIKLAKIRPPQRDQLPEDLKHQRGIGIALRHRDEVYILVFDVAEGRGAQGQDRGPHGGVGDDLDAEDVGEAGAAVLAVGAEDEVLAFLVEDQEA